MNSLLCKDALWKWTKDCVKAFQMHQGCSGMFHFVIHYHPGLP